MSTDTQPSTAQLLADLNATSEHRTTASGQAKTTDSRKIKRLVHQLNEHGIEGTAADILATAAGLNASAPTATAKPPTATAKAKATKVPTDDQGRILRLWDGAYTERGQNVTADRLEVTSLEHASPQRIARGCVIQDHAGTLRIVTKRTRTTLMVAPYDARHDDPVTVNLDQVAAVVTQVTAS